MSDMLPLRPAQDLDPPYSVDAPHNEPVLHRAADWARVVEALPRLRADPTRHIFGAREPYGGHEFAIGPCLGERELAALEAEHRVRLPAELRSFLATVGNGPGVPLETKPSGWVVKGGAGPGYGLYDVRGALAANRRVSSPFVPMRSRAQIEAVAETEDDYAPAGLIELGTHGCSWDYGVVITGPWAGTIWTYEDPGWIPSSPARAEIVAAHHDDADAARDWLLAHLDEVPVDTFADWYLSWLDDAESL